MRLRTFTAPSMADAMRQVREDLGTDAIIVSTYTSNGGRGVQVTAAIEPVPERAAIGTEDLEGRLEAQLRERLHTEVDALKAGPLAKQLAFHGAPRTLAERIDRAATALNADTPVLALAGALDTLIRFRPLPEAPETPLLIIGPPGTGKSVTVAKLAARAVLAGADVQLISCDTDRAGALPQMEAFSKLLQKPLTAARSPDELKNAIPEAPADGKRAITCLIDTPGTNPYDSAEMGNLKEFIDSVGADPVLVLAAGGDAEEAAEIAEIFADLGARRLVVTRLDTTRRFGSVIAASATSGLAISEISITPYIADGLKSVNPVSLSRLILHEGQEETDAEESLEPDLSEATA